MKTTLVLVLAAAVAGPVLAANPFGATATISGVKCRTVDLTPDDGLAAYGSFVVVPGEGAFGVQGKVIGQEGWESFYDSKEGSATASPFLNISKRAATGTVQVVADGEGTASLMQVTAITAPDRFYDAFSFAARHSITAKLGPFSAIACSGHYVVTAWAKQSLSAPGAAGAIAAISYGQAGVGLASESVQASVNPANGKASAQKSGKFTFQFTNQTPNETSVNGTIKAWISGGQVTANP